MFLHKVHQVLQRPGAHLSVWVEQQDIVSGGLLDSLVVATCKAYVFSVFDQPRLWKPLAQHGGASICGGIVNYQHLKLILGRMCIYRFKASGQHVTNVPIHDDDGKYHDFYAFDSEDGRMMICSRAISPPIKSQPGTLARIPPKPTLYTKGNTQSPKME